MSLGQLRNLNITSNTAIWSTVAVLVVTFLVFDGIITNLPFYNLQSHLSFRFHFFYGLEVVVCALSQIIYLRVIKRMYSINPTLGYFKRYANIIYTLVSFTQFAIIGLLLLTIAEIEIFGQYHTSIMLSTALLSLSLSIAISSLLVFRFLMWIRYKADYLILAYSAAAILITLNSCLVASFLLLETENKPTVIDPSIFWTNTQITNYQLHQIQSYVSLLSFLSLWAASFFLLRRQRSKWQAAKFYACVLIPLFYYFGLPQLILSEFLIQHDVLDTFQGYTFNVINSILSRPVGGVLFGVGFWLIARNTRGNKIISNYMKLSAFGIMLLSISNTDAGLYLLPYPPFGLPTISFVGISSYMLFVGIYYASISISMNSELRKSIEKSVEQEINFISKIGKSEIDREIQNKVNTIMKKSVRLLEENSGVESSIDDADITEYIKLVVNEKAKVSANIKRAKSENDYEGQI